MSLQNHWSITAGLMAAVLGLAASAEANKRCCPPKPCCEVVTPAPAAKPAPSKEPATPTPTAPSQEPAPDIDFSMASSMDTAGDAQSMSPNMIGDQFGSSIFQSSSLPANVGGRVTKVGESGSPLTRHRAALLFNHFENVYSINGFNHSVQRNTFLYERPFAGNVLSTELRIPFSHGPESQQNILGGNRAAVGNELGNVWTALKALAYQDETLAIGIGAGLTLPTADNQASLAEGLIENDTYTLSPFIGGLYTPNSRWFSSGFMQANVPLNSDDVFSAAGVFAGSYDHQNELIFDISTGYWIYLNPGAGGITGIAPIIETHYTTTLDDTEVVGGVTNPFNRQDIINATAGVTLMVNDNTNVTIAGAVPVSDGVGDRQFDSEFIVQFNRFFGGGR